MRPEQRPYGDTRGVVFVEKLIAYTPLLLTFFAGFQLAELSAAKLIVSRASSAAGRAATVVLPDDPVFYDGVPVHEYRGARKDDIVAAAKMVLAAAPQIGEDVRVEVGARPTENFGPFEVEVSATYHCGGVRLVCGFDGKTTLTARTRHAYHRAQYEYEALPFEVPAFQAQNTSSGQGDEAQACP